MNTLLLMFIISLSMFIGMFIVFFIDNKKEKILGHLLGFSCGIIIALLVFDIFSEVIIELNIFWLIGLATLGYLLSKNLDKLVPHHHEHNKTKTEKKKTLFHVGVITFVGIMLHNIPLGIALSSPIYYSTNNKKKTFIYTGVAVLSTLIGGLIGLLFSNLFVKFNLPIYILSITSGMLSYVVVDELLPTAKKYNKKFIYSVILGILSMFLISFI